METTEHKKDVPQINLYIAISCFLLAFIGLSILLLGARSTINPQGLLLTLAALGLGIICIIPALISMHIHDGQFDLFHPLLYGALFFFLPSFVLSSILLSLGITTTKYASLVPDVWHAQMVALGLAYLGSIGLSIGYFLPLSKKIGKQLPAVSAFTLTSSIAQRAAFIFLSIGLLSLVLAFREGVFGYQFNAQISRVEAIFASFADLVIIGHAMIWFGYYKSKKGWLFLRVYSISIILLVMLLSGSRGSLFHSSLLIVAGFQYAQEKHRFSRVRKWIVILFVALFAGIIFGSVYRQNSIKLFGRTTSINFTDATSLATGSVRDVQAFAPTGGVASYGLDRILERIDGVTSLGVIAINAERLKNAEKSIGINNNIVRDLTTSLIPRFMWPSKPTVGGAEEIGNLYFRTELTSPAVTYMGDLFRNFGIWGIFPGMMLIGTTLRILYVWLIEKHELTTVRVGLYMFLGFIVNYEGMFSSYIPAIIRAIFIAIVAIVIINILNHRRHPISHTAKVT